MIASRIIAKILPHLLKKVFEAVMPELKPLQKYVYEKNELDEKVEKLEKRINDLECDKNNMKSTKESMYSNLKKEIQKIKNANK